MIFGKTEIQTDPAPISLDSRGYTVWVFLIEHKKLRTYEKSSAFGQPSSATKATKAVRNSFSLDFAPKISAHLCS